LSDEACIEKKNYCEKAGCQKLFTAKCNNDAKTNETIEQFYGELDQQDRKDNLTGTDFSRMLAIIYRISYQSSGCNSGCHIIGKYCNMHCSSIKLHRVLEGSSVY
jgi:hypothetical protein